MKAGQIAVIGRANAGKSTLINAMVGEKISIVSPKPQTTRNTILGVLTREEYQIVFTDTPGLYKASSLLSSYMQKEVELAARDVDAILYVIDAHAGLHEEELKTLARFVKTGLPIAAVLTKTDIMKKEDLPLALVRVSEVANIPVVPISARKNRGLNELLSVLLSLLPEGEPLFPETVVSDKSEKFMCAEIMREKILVGYEKEIPHGIAVVMNRFEQDERGVWQINLDIICEKQNHKAIIIGKQGKALKETLSHARESMERFLGAKVFLQAYVVVKENWRDRNAMIRDFGYEVRKD